MSDKRIGEEKFHELYEPCDVLIGDKPLISAEEYMQWKSKKQPEIARRAKCIVDDGEAAMFLRDNGWRRKDELPGMRNFDALDGNVPDCVGLYPPYYYVIEYTDWDEAVRLELWSQEYAKFRQNILEEKAING